ncbi:AraC family transcriptional regulator [Rhodococcus pyridinivorans SB3094]|uniref:AraC family transcriptional regulator n=1 Tax=Rhodococcus pyridinivorans SB3094 TaxID=1435356 RepID=V9XHV6_9NOCA|nr:MULTISPECIES: effector binding domain-containing protein [Rhodococcus]AHD23051.1 AraC family transcriptional regulator [Rhodococcus pyridinivorans SB3094]MCT7290793.1 GyrI-like domain-containing protein [Rhodococcus sp. PAE-6]MXQ75053.1 AraC family transcriptional regulator [Rhodococcus rhodochrous]
MSFEIVRREQTLVAGLPVRSPRRALGQVRDRALERAWHAVLKEKLGGPLASAYTDHAVEIGSYYTQTVGYRCESLDQVSEGHFVACVPAGTYAKFSSMGNFPQVVSDLWEQVGEAEASGAIQRSFVGDFESYPNAFSIDLYVSVFDSGKGGGR